MLCLSLANLLLSRAQEPSLAEGKLSCLPYWQTKAPDASPAQKPPIQDFRATANFGFIYLSFLFPFFIPLYSISCPVQLLRGFHNLALHCYSGREVGSRLRSLGEKAKAYFCQLSHLSSELIYQTLLSTYSVSPCDWDKGFRTEQSICVLLPSTGSQTCWKIEPQINHYNVEQ